MVDVRVCLWNIQNFGQSTPRYDGVYHVNGNAMRNQFIARLVRQHNIDVLLIQEAQADSLTALADLQRKLNALHTTKDWAYSWCGSALARSNVDRPADFNDLTMTTGARSEGYAVLWRRNQDRFKLVDGLTPIAYNSGPISVRPTSPLNISQLGRPTGKLAIGGAGRADDQETFGATGGFTTARAYPNQYDKDDDSYDNLDAWPKLNYPPTAGSDPNKLKWAKARRPVYVVLKLGDNNTRLCPVSVYHAPSNADRSSWGAFIAGLARELYAIDKVAGLTPNPDDAQVATRVVFGGDFNNSVAEDDWPDDYNYFVAARAATIDGGAAKAVAPAVDSGDAARRTTVQILQGAQHDEPIESVDPNDYLRHKIDLLFYGGDVAARRIDLMAEVTDNDVYDLAIKHAYKLMNDTEASVGDDEANRRMTDTGPQYKGVGSDTWKPMICGSWGGTFVDWAESCRQFQAGEITDARRAAEYIHLFVSDHMPLLATVSY
ncbi:endonuclease/exonuclease/phosphatase family protein [Caulobacter sp.]|uniref:endonuclease/exonuclease/phosphatase family protein n=1 Tax=Caulobacter sp. TaxID=78 RepID=UPI002B478452|nr:endonuclease/exonuclease/phosphatase family protein [Caulobacter sp.]HJV41708.1 endonuclease/exonuclease/phosphatase family protein [Caulobacter sp.]